MDCMLDWMNQPSGARAKNTVGHVGNKHSNYPYHKHTEYYKLITLVGSTNLDGLQSATHLVSRLTESVCGYVNYNK